MPYQVDWYLENRIVFIEFSGEITLDDLENADRESAQLLAKQSHPVHIIVGMVSVTKFPLNLYAVVQRFTGSKLPSYGRTVIFGTNMLVSKFINSLSKVAHMPIKTTPNMSEAVDYLRQQDESLEKMLSKTDA